MNSVTSILSQVNQAATDLQKNAGNVVTTVKSINSIWASPQPAAIEQRQENEVQTNSGMSFNLADNMHLVYGVALLLGLYIIKRGK